MILQISPDAPFIVHAIAALALFLHIAGGGLAIVAGFVSILAKKGGRVHRAAGNVFFVSMLAMAGVGAVVSPMLPSAQWTNTTAAVFTLYITLTAWVTARRRPGEVGRFEIVAMATAVGVVLTTPALIMVLAAQGRLGGPQVVYVFSAIALIAAHADWRMIRAGGISGAARTRRHLWRMSLALAVAAGSFFLGQQDELPAALRGTFWPTIPPLSVLALLAYGMWRFRNRQRPAPRPSPRAGSVPSIA